MKKLTYILTISILVFSCNSKEDYIQNVYVDEYDDCDCDGKLEGDTVTMMRILMMTTISTMMAMLMTLIMLMNIITITVS